MDHFIRRVTRHCENKTKSNPININIVTQSSKNIDIVKSSNVKTPPKITRNSIKYCGCGSPPF